jgi:trans-aconitate 2-methyltransferase
MPWNVSQYLQFGDERTRPAVDLAARIALSEPRAVADLGCGPGNSTQVLRRRWPGASVLGVDRSPEMIAAASAAHPEQVWLQADIETWAPAAPFDIVFSNAALQWLGDHPRLVRRLLGFVAPGGALAFQIPSDAYSPVRTYIREIADDPVWRDRMDGPRAALTMESPAVYYDALASQARSLDIWETEYSHVMDNPQAIVAWISSTSLRLFLEALDAGERAEFTCRLTHRVEAGYARRADGRVLFPFRRLFVIAYV